MYTDDNSVHNPYYRITTVHEMLVFGLKICDLLTKCEIDEKKILEETVIDNIRIHPTWSKKHIAELTSNLRLCVLGNCFIVIDEALDDMFGRKPETYEEK